MEQTLLPGDVVALAAATNYSRGEIIVFPDPNGGRALSIKRVIGLPSDLVELRDGAVFVNGTALAEPYTYDEFDDPVITQAFDEESWQIKPGALFVLGDHRNQSVDSRSYGPIEHNTVVGRATVRCSPSPGSIK
jgi:signal peptidase I